MRARITDYKQYIKDRIKINETTGCWEWQRVRNADDYGICSNIIIAGNKYTLAHRLSLIVYGGKFTRQKPLSLHSCNNPPCVNPAHLRAGSRQDNSDDMKKAGHSTKGKKQPKIAAAKLKKYGYIITPLGQFNSLREASDAHNCKPWTIGGRIKNDQYPEYYRDTLLKD